jgi:GNAT superfamily N-acetyltransferase
MRIEPLTPDRFPDLADLFETNATTRGCWCAYFLITNREFSQGWGGGNRSRFEQLASAGAPPAGLLAYRDHQPVGWCAMGPRSRYPRAMRSLVLKGRDPDEDDRVWLVPCFFVRRTARRTGVTRALLAAAVESARRAGAPAIEGFPLAGERKRAPGDAYLGLEPVFAACGFTPVARPTPARVVMRRNLQGIDRRARLM